MKAFLIWLALASAAFAGPVTVKSGEHAGFTRLVLELDAPAGWQLGRTPDGYALRLEGDISFDLAQVYSLIRRDRLSAIWVDPASGDLRLGIGCACHAMPFAFRPDVLVIDLRDGPPPTDSVFEVPVAAVPAAAGESPLRPKPRPVLMATAIWPPAPAPAPAAPLLPGLADPALTGLRDSLLEELSRGVARGVVDIAADLPPPQPHSALTQARIGPEPGFDAAPATRGADMLTGAGLACLKDSRLDLASWGSDGSAAEQMARAIHGVVGEFDTPDPEAVARAARQLLHLGFGAETLHLLRSFDTQAADQPIWEIMARILDEGHGPPGPFTGMAQCDSAAALWAFLAAPDGQVPVNTAAVLRSFSGLPLHLRHHLGPMLAERFLARSDAASARSIRDAILRAGDDHGPAVRLMTAEVELAQGRDVAAEATLAGLAAEAGPTTAQATLAWVERLLAEGKSVDPATVTTLAALIPEHAGAELEPALGRAHVLALAASGDFDSAFTQLVAVPEAEAALWARLATTGPDSAVLTHAVRPPEQLLPDSDPATRARLADRLNGLGLAAEALRWLPPDPAASPEARVLAAEAEIARRDGNAGLRLIAGLQGETAERLRAEAALLLGDAATAAVGFAALNDDAGAARAAWLAGDWASIAASGPEPWANAAGLVATAAASSAANGPLARGQTLVGESAAARATLAELLVAVPPL